VTNALHAITPDNQQRLRVLNVLLADRFDDLFADLGVSFRKTPKVYLGSCPVHGGNNATAFHHSGDETPGHWRCYTRHCEQAFHRSIIGFVRGVLSHNRFGWVEATKGGAATQTVGFWATVEYCCRFLGVNFPDLRIEEVSDEKRHFFEVH
jgi:hypothetical protein